MSETTRPVIGIIGGSGLYDLPGLEEARWQKVDSPFGEASDELLFGSLAQGGHVRVTVGEDDELTLSPEPVMKELEHLAEKE